MFDAYSLQIFKVEFLLTFLEFIFDIFVSFFTFFFGSFNAKCFLTLLLNVHGWQLSFQIVLLQDFFSLLFLPTLFHYVCIVCLHYWQLSFQVILLQDFIFEFIIVCFRLVFLFIDIISRFLTNRYCSDNVFYWFDGSHR